MEFAEKLQLLRKQAELTQEELAAKLFVSRTAVSKWETGNGYPNLDSLKDVAKLFNVSVDELLSNEELLGIADEENKSSGIRMLGVVFGILDIAMLSFFFLPLFGIQVGDFIAMTSLVEYSGPNYFLVAFSAVFVGLAIIGIVEVIASFRRNETLCSRAMACSLILHVLGVFAFTMTREPYATGLIFVFLVVKATLMLYQRSKMSR